MRRLPFPAGLLAAALLVPLISLFSAANASAVTFTDTTFADADWVIRGEAVTPGSSHTFGQDTTPGAGNPSPYRRMTHTNPVHPMGSGSTFTTITHERETWSYDPAVSGAIDHIDISMDRIVFSATAGGQPSPSSAVGHVFRIYQDGLAFFPANDPRAFSSRSWENIALTNLWGTDFVSTTNPGALNPDFSAAGGVITFGYGRSNTNTAQSVEVITTHGIDNFTVTVVPIPESSTLCDPAPLDTCLLAAKASLSIAEKKPGKEKLKAKLQAFDAATDQADFGDPVAGATRYDLCLYDAAGALAGELSVDRAGQTCGPKESSCFKDKGGNGWIYKDPAVEADGTKKIVIATGGVGKGKAQWQAQNNAKKQQDAMPTGLTAALEGADTATLQLVASDGACFSATLDTVKTSDAESFKAKAP